MTQTNVVDQPQKFNSIEMMMEFIDQMVAKGYSMNEAMTACEEIVRRQK